MVTAAIATLLVIWIVGLVVYVRSLARVYVIARNTKEVIFGRQYENFFSMGSDPYVLNKLWSGKDICNHASENLISALRMARKLLMWQFAFSIVMFVVLMSRAISQPG